MPTDLPPSPGTPGEGRGEVVHLDTAKNALQARPQRRLLTFAKAMRTGQTDAERKLWHLLRDRRLGGFKFRRQVPIAGYVVDFYCLEGGLVVESDGGQHCDPGQEEYDRRRTYQLSELGIRVIRFPDNEVLKFPDAVREAIHKALTENET